jgi:hypothetical protein
MAAMHQLQGKPDPIIHEMAYLQQVLRGVKRCQAKASVRECPRLPISPELLLKLHSVWCGGSMINRDQRMLWAAAILCLFGFLRCGEITVPSEESYEECSRLSVSDVTVDNMSCPLMLKVHLKASKTDPFGWALTSLLVVE